jgi:hypothetical protein
MAKVLHFHGDTLLKGVFYDGAKAFGTPEDFTPVWNAAAGKWDRNLKPVTRTVTYKSRPSLHECDDRCMFAKGRTMQCECACGGKNHGNGFRAASIKIQAAA